MSHKARVTPLRNNIIFIIKTILLIECEKIVTKHLVSNKMFIKIFEIKPRVSYNVTYLSPDVEVLQNQTLKPVLNLYLYKIVSPMFLSFQLTKHKYFINIFFHLRFIISDVMQVQSV